MKAVNYYMQELEGIKYSEFGSSFKVQNETGATNYMNVNPDSVVAFVVWALKDDETAAKVKEIMKELKG